VRSSTGSAHGAARPNAPASPRYRVVIHEITDGVERITADYTVDGSVVALGRRSPGNKFMHNTLRAGPLDLTFDLASVIPNAMAEFIAKHLPGR